MSHHKSCSTHSGARQKGRRYPAPSFFSTYRGVRAKGRQTFYYFGEPLKMSNSDSNHIDPSPNIEMFVRGLFQGISHHLENSSDQDAQPTPSTKLFDPNNSIFYIPPAAKDPAEANNDRQLTKPQAGIIHLRIQSDSDDAAAWRSEWDPPSQEGVGCLNWKEFTVMLTLAGMAWQVFFPGFF